jgi:hypothetical protein
MNFVTIMMNTCICRVKTIIIKLRPPTMLLLNKSSERSHLIRLSRTAGHEGYRLRSSPVLKYPGGKSLLDEEIERNELRDTIIIKLRPPTMLLLNKSSERSHLIRLSRTVRRNTGEACACYGVLYGSGV